MTTRKEMSRINQLLSIIQKEGRINKVRLVMMSNISISYFEKLRPFLMELYGDHITYDKDSKMFISLQKARINEG